MSNPHRLRRSTRIVWLAIAVVLGGGLAIVGNRPSGAAAAAITATVDGRAVTLAGPTATVAAVLKTAGVRPRDGALLSLITHKVLDPHFVPSIVTLGGRAVGPRARVRDGDEVGVIPGIDVTEAPSTTRVPVPPALPPDVENTLWYPGAPGADEVVAGAQSGEEMSRVRAAEPTAPVEEHAKVVALTFDDGPTPQWTPQVLQILKDEGVTATFCDVGHWVETRSDLARAERDAGMAMCDHTEHHVLRLDTKGHDQVVQEVIGGADAQKAVLGADASLFRSPGGSLSGDVVGVAHSRHMRVVQWTVDPHDYERPPPNVIFDRIMAQVRPGAVILMHDGGGDRSNTVAQLRQLIDTLKAQGYSFATPLGPPPAPPPPPPAPPPPTPGV